MREGVIEREGKSEGEKGRWRGREGVIERGKERG